MKKLLAFFNWPTKIKFGDDGPEQFDLPFIVDTHHPRRNPDEETRPMYRIGGRDPRDIQKVIDSAG